MRTRDLAIAQTWLVALMREHQFGRIENLQIKRGLPVPDPSVRITRVTRLGGGNGGVPELEVADFALKRSVIDLLDELTRVGDGTRVRIEFRRGLPCLLETEQVAGLERHSSKG